MRIYFEFWRFYCGLDIYNYACERNEFDIFFIRVINWKIHWAKRRYHVLDVDIGQFRLTYGIDCIPIWAMKIGKTNWENHGNGWHRV